MIAQAETWRESSFVTPVRHICWFPGEVICLDLGESDYCIWCERERERELRLIRAAGSHCSGQGEKQTRLSCTREGEKRTET